MLQIVARFWTLAVIIQTTLLVAGNAETLVITAFQQLNELYIDGTMVPTLPNAGNPNIPDYVTMENSTRLIALKAINIDARIQCGGVLASAVDNSIITDNSFKCIETEEAGWFQLGFDDSSWTNAGEYGNNTVGRIDCSQNEPIADINPNAKWIWTNIIYIPVVFCRGYTAFCNTSSPCLNGGTCLNNSPQMCACTPQYTGNFCETDLTYKTLVITADGTLDELHVDGRQVETPNGGTWNIPDYVTMESSNRLIAAKATNLGYPQCGGVLASAVDNFVITDKNFKCTATDEAGWFELGYDDSSWANASEYGDNRVGRIECSQNEPIADIDPNAKWIWTNNRANITVYCRGYTTFCNTSSPCLNGGTCLKNDQSLCVCLPQFTGVFCETALSVKLTITAKSTLYEIFLDGAPVPRCHCNSASFPDEIELQWDSQLIAVSAIDTTGTCAGILASVTNDFLVTGSTWKCTADPPPYWYTLGFNDDAWSDAYVIGPNHNVTWPAECRVLEGIDSISANASWIWTPSILETPLYDDIIYCRAYLPTCDQLSICLNGGKCNRNNITLCTCLPGYTGVFCESELEITMNITAKSVIYELFIDEIRQNLAHNDDWTTVDGIPLSPKSRLIAILAADSSESCAGILASVADDYLLTDSTWKCDVGPPPNWYRFEFDDSAWPSAYVIGPNGDVTWPDDCQILTNVPSVSQNASWIWTSTITGAPFYDHAVYCRAYLPFCETAQPCQNGGTCNRNSATLCSCPGGFTGVYCESLL